MPSYEIHQKDPNQDAIVKAMREAGATVEHMGRPVDLLVGVLGITGVAEVKKPKAPLRDSQEKFFGRFRGMKAVLRTEAEGVAFVQHLRYVARGGCPANDDGKLTFGVEITL